MSRGNINYTKNRAHDNIVKTMRPANTKRAPSSIDVVPTQSKVSMRWHNEMQEIRRHQVVLENHKEQKRLDEALALFPWKETE